jgi:hypothetical protein
MIMHDNGNARMKALLFSFTHNSFYKIFKVITSKSPSVNSLILLRKFLEAVSAP